MPVGSGEGALRHILAAKIAGCCRFSDSISRFLVHLKEPRMIFRRMRVPEPRDSKRMRLVKVALLAFLLTPKIPLVAFVMTPILVYFYQKRPLTGPEIPKTDSLKARRDATQIIQRHGYQCPTVQLLYLKGPAPDGNVLQALCGPIGEDKVYPTLTYRIALRGGLASARPWGEGDN